MKRTVVFFLQAGVGGAERVTVTIAKMLDQKKFSVIFCLVGDSASTSSIENFIPNDYKVCHVKKTNTFFFICSLARVILKFNSDIVFSSMMYINTKILFLAPFFYKVKFIVRNNNYLYNTKIILKKSKKMIDILV